MTYLACLKVLLPRLLPVVILLAIAGLSKAGQDTLVHHYAGSIFDGGHAQFWNPALSWKNKYADWDGGDHTERFVLATTWLVALTDGWHLLDNLRTLALLAGAMWAGQIAGPFRWRLLALGTICMVVFTLIFHLAYTYWFL